VLAGAGTYDYLADLDVLTFSALEASVTRVRYRQKSEDANTSAIILGLIGGEKGQKPFEDMLKVWRGITNDAPPSPSVEKVSGSYSRLKNDFAAGGF